MKRTNLVLDEHLLEEAKRLSGEKTYSATVQKALVELVKFIKMGRILELRGCGTWEGDLAEMRRDNPRRRPRSATGTSRKPRSGAKKGSR